MNLQILELSIIPLITIVVHFLLIMIVTPMLISFDRRRLPFSKSMFRYLVQGLFYIILITYFLALVKLYEFFSLVSMYFLIFLVILFIKNRNQKFKETILAKKVWFLCLLETDLNGQQMIIKISRSFQTFIVKTFRSIGFYQWIALLLFAIAVFVRFAVRVFNPMAMAAMADPYVHLTWAKMILINRLFTDGLYPLGYNSIIASIGRLSNFDMYHVVRFMGPIGSCILLIGLYWFLKVITQNQLHSILGMIIFGFSTFNGLPVEFFRQTLSLPMEFSIAFIFPGLIFLHDYIVKGNRNDLLHYWMTVVVVVIIHSYGALFFAISSAVLMLSAFLNRCLTIKNFSAIFITGISAGIIGMLPILIGKLQGVKWHLMSTSWISSNVKTASIGEVIKGFGNQLGSLPPFILIVGCTVLGGILYSAIVNIIFSKKKKCLWETTIFTLMAVIMVLYFGPEHGFSLLDPTRVTMFLTMVLLIGVILFISNFIQFMGSFYKKASYTFWMGLWGRIIICSIIAVFTLAWLIAFPIQLSSENPMALRPIEYNSAISVYYNVKKEYPLFDWTLVAPVEQYQEALGYGYHYELWKFNEDFSLVDASNPLFDIPIPTTYIFIYVEKIPLQIWTNNEIASTPEYFKGKTEIHYRDSVGRAKLEKSMWEWCEAYMKTHDNMTVFFENEELKVYKVEHDPSEWVGK
jgi:hypothetical protein